MDETLYRCVRCDGINDAENWTDSTKEYVQEFGKSGDDVKTLSEDIIESKDCVCYVCPDCLEPCYIEDGQILAVD